MVDYRDDWKYSKPIPKEPSRRAYEEGWERVFAKKTDMQAVFEKSEAHLNISVHKERKP